MGALWVALFPMWQTALTNISVHIQAFLMGLPIVVGWYVAVLIVLPLIDKLWPQDAERAALPQTFSDEIIIDDNTIRVRNETASTTYSWDLLTAVHDSEHTVMLLGPLHSVCISATAFDGFLAKDAFVRACRARVGEDGSGLEVFD